MGYKFIGKKCSKYLWMSSRLRALVFLDDKIRVDEILLCKYMLLTVNELEESCFIKLIAYSKNIYIYSYSSQIPWGRQQQPATWMLFGLAGSHWMLSIPAMLLFLLPSFLLINNQSSPSPTDFLCSAKMGSIGVLPSELGFLPWSCVAPRPGVCGLQAAQVSLLCGSPWCCTAAQWSLYPWLQF